MHKDYAELAGLFALATGDGSAAVDMTSRIAVKDGCTSDDVDKQIVSIPANLDREKVEAIGVVILDELPESLDEREESFVRVKIPDGWTVVDSKEDHRGRYVIDERGVNRLSTFDNGQFWDRYVSTSVVRQYHEVPLRLCYGEGTLETVLWDRLTADERAEAIDGLKDHVAKGEESPKIYADTAAKAQHWLDETAKLS